MAAYILEGVTVAQPFSPHLARYGITSRDQLPPHGHGLGACDLTIAHGRVARIAPSGAPPPPAAPALSASFAEVALAAPAAGGEAPALRRVPLHNCFAWPGLIDSSVHSIPTILDTTGAARRAVGLLNLLHGVTSVRETGLGSEAAAADEALAVALGQLPAPRHFWVGRPVDGAGSGAGSSGATTSTGSSTSSSGGGGSPPSLLPRWVKASVATERAASQAAASAALGACGLEVGSGASLEALEAARACGEARGLPLLGHVPHPTPYGACGMRELMHLSGLPPLPCAAWAPCPAPSAAAAPGASSGAFADWLSTWHGEGISASAAHAAAVAQVCAREGYTLTPCLARFWAGALCCEAAAGSSSSGAGCGGGAADVEEGGQGAAPAARPPPLLPLSGGLPAPAAALAHARAWLPQYVPACLWGDGGAPGGGGSATWAAAAGRLLTSAYLPALSLPAAAALRGALPGMLAAVRQLHAGGACLHAGSGALSHWAVPGAALHVELALLRSAGLSDEEALAAATVLPGAAWASQGNFCGAGGGAGGAGVGVGVGEAAAAAAEAAQQQQQQQQPPQSMLPPPLDYQTAPQEAAPGAEGEAAAAAAAAAAALPSASAAPPPPAPAELAARLARLRASRLAWLGFVCEGGFADLVVSRVDPRGDLLGALESIVAVVAAGEVRLVGELEGALAGAAEAKDENLASTLLKSQVGPLLAQTWRLFGGGQ